MMAEGPDVKVMMPPATMLPGGGTHLPARAFEMDQEGKSPVAVALPP
jgi:hypothetical protein